MQSIPLAVLKHDKQKVCPWQSAYCMQSIPLAVLKQICLRGLLLSRLLHAIHTACGIETRRWIIWSMLPKDCMQSIPLAVLKHNDPLLLPRPQALHAIHTACGIETSKHGFREPHNRIACNPYRLRYWNFPHFLIQLFVVYCMQSIPLAVLKQNAFHNFPSFLKLHAIHTACGIFFYF